MENRGGLLNWCPSFCTESHSCSGCHSSNLSGECSTITCEWPLSRPLWVSIMLFVLLNVLAYIRWLSALSEIFFVKAALSCSWQSCHSARNRWKKTEKFSCFLPFFLCGNNFWRLNYIWMDGFLPMELKLYKSHSRQQDVWGPVCETQALFSFRVTVFLFTSHSQRKVVYSEHHPRPGCSRRPKTLAEVAFTENNFLFYP